ncbi:hypothetical protein Vafri_11256 [Volvox africanus]|nr:hypothetical protein Vafri_11256 [Volvox africanus]
MPAVAGLAVDTEVTLAPASVPAHLGSDPPAAARRNRLNVLHFHSHFHSLVFCIEVAVAGADAGIAGIAGAGTVSAAAATAVAAKALTDIAFGSAAMGLAAIAIAAAMAGPAVAGPRHVGRGWQPETRRQLFHG